MDQLDEQTRKDIEDKLKSQTKNTYLAFSLWFFLGIVGVHNFYLRRFYVACFEVVLCMVIANHVDNGQWQLSSIASTIWLICWIYDAFQIKSAIINDTEQKRQRLIDQALGKDVPELAMTRQEIVICAGIIALGLLLGAYAASQKEKFEESKLKPANVTYHLDVNESVRAQQSISNEQIINNYLNSIEKDQMAINKLNNSQISQAFTEFINSSQEHLIDTETLQRELCYEVSGNICRDIVPSDLAFLYQQISISYQLVSDLVNNQKPVIGYVFQESAESQMLSRLGKAVSLDLAQALKKNTVLFLTARDDYLKVVNALCQSQGLNAEIYLNQALYNWYLMRESLLGSLVALGFSDDLKKKK
jgi:TM2 domain-containing membrane protein YozV